MSARRRSKKADEGWQPTLDRITQIQKISRRPNVESRGYQNQLRYGKLWVRDRIELLADPESFKEIGTITGTPKFNPPLSNNLESFVPTNYVAGLATIQKRKVVIAADDFTIRAGHADGALFGKSNYIEQLAQSLYIPIIRLIDGSSGGGSVAVYRDYGGTYVPPSTGAGWQVMIDSMSLIPVVGAVLGSTVGIGAAKVSCTHFSIICADIGSLFNAGPIVVEKAGIEEGLTNADLGGPGVVCVNGAIDNVGKTEKDCYEQIKMFLSYLPSSVVDMPPVHEYKRSSAEAAAKRAAALDSAIPTSRTRGYAIYPIIKNLFDEDSFFEIGPLWGSPAIVGFARLRGYSVGVLAFNAESPTLGALTVQASKKLQRHVELCSLFGIPIVQLVDMPGFTIGSQAEREGTMRAGVDVIKAYYACTVPIFNVLIRKVYGVAGAFLVDTKLPHYRVAWPSGEWGSLPLEGGVEAAFAHDLKQAFLKGGQEGYNQLLASLMAEFRVLSDPLRTATYFQIEEIVRPSATRDIIAEWVTMMYGTTLKQRLRAVQAKVEHNAGYMSKL